jgi:hypothetical protein
MNCKPGDLAVVVNDLDNPRNNGALVKVVCRADRAEYDAPIDWDCEAVSTIIMERDGVVFRADSGEGEFGYQDLELRPIRDPGEDAKDETLNWLPVPHKEIA